MRLPFKAFFGKSFSENVGSIVLCFESTICSWFQLNQATCVSERTTREEVWRAFYFLFCSIIMVFLFSWSFLLKTEEEGLSLSWMTLFYGDVWVVKLLLLNSLGITKFLVVECDRFSIVIISFLVNLCFMHRRLTRRLKNAWTQSPKNVIMPPQQCFNRILSWFEYQAWRKRNHLKVIILCLLLDNSFWMILIPFLWPFFFVMSM